MTFTVKFRSSAAEGDTEILYSAETVEVIYPGNAVAGSAQTSNWDQAGIYLDREPPSLPTPGEPTAPRCAKHIILFGGDHTSEAQARRGGRVWVMNDAGATVANIEL